jgi:hypothetical protein
MILHRSRSAASEPAARRRRRCFESVFFLLSHFLFQNTRSSPKGNKPLHRKHTRFQVKARLIFLCKKRQDLQDEQDKFLGVIDIKKPFANPSLPSPFWGGCLEIMTTLSKIFPILVKSVKSVFAFFASIQSLRGGI